MATTSRQVHLLIVSEVLLVTGVAATLGLIPGYILTSLLRRAFASGGAIPSDFGLVYSPLPAVAGVVLPVATASVAAWLVARRPARARPVEALAEASVEPTRLHPARLGCGWVLAGIGVATSLMPLILPGELAVSLATVQLFTQSTLSATAAEQADMGVTADIIVTGTRTGLAPSVARAVAAVSGVDAVAPIVRSQVLISYTELGDPTAAPFTPRPADLPCHRPG